MNSRPNTYINEDIAELIANLAEDELIRRGDAETVAMLGGSPAGMIARIRAIPADTQLSTLREELNQTLADMRFHVEDAVKAWNEVEANRVRAETAEREVEYRTTQLSNAELQIQTLQQEIHEIKASAKIMSAAADRHYNNAIKQHELAELRTNQLDDAYDRIKTLNTALTEAHSMLLWCERRMVSPSIATYPKHLAEAIGKILYE